MGLFTTSDDIKYQWNKGYSDVNPNSRLVFSNGKDRILNLNNDEWSRAEEVAKNYDAPRYNQFDDSRFIIHNAFMQMFQDDRSLMYDKLFRNTDAAEREKIVSDEIDLINLRKAFDKYANNSNFLELSVLTPRALAALVNEGYMSEDELRLAGLEAYKRKQTLTNVAYSAVGDNFRPSDMYDPDRDPNLLDEKRRQKVINENIPSLYLERNSKALKFALHVHDLDVKNEAALDKEAIKSNIYKRKEAKENVDAEFRALANQVSPLFRLTSSDEYRKKWRNDDLWNTILDDDKYDAKIDMLSEYYAMALYDLVAAERYFNDRLQDIADANASDFSESLKFADHVAHTTASQIGVGLVFTTNLLEGLFRTITLGKDEALRVGANRMLGKNADWSEEAEAAAIEKALAELPENASEEERNLAVLKAKDSFNMPLIWNMDYWSKVGNYSTFNPNSIKKIDNDYDGISRYSYIDPSTGPTTGTKIGESAEMAALFAAQAAVSKGLVGGTSALLNTSRLYVTKAAINAATTANRLLAANRIANVSNVMGKVGSFGTKTSELLLPLQQISGAYAYGNFREAYDDNMNTTRYAVANTAVEEMKRRALTEDGQNWIYNRALELKEEDLRLQKEKDPEGNQPYIQRSDQSFYDAAYLDYIYNSPEHDEYVKEIMNTPEYKAINDAALRSAASAAYKDGMIETFKYAPIRMFFQRWTMSNATAQSFNRAIDKYNPLKGTKDKLFGRKIVEANGEITRTQNALGKFYEKYGHAINGTFWGGGVSNYTDELASAYAVHANKESFKENVEDLYKENGYLSLHKTSDVLSSAMADGFVLGNGGTGYSLDLWKDLAARATSLLAIDAFKVGFLGTVIAPNINGRFFNRKARQGEKRFNSDINSYNFGLYEGSGINMATGERMSNNIIRRLGRSVVGYKGLFTTGFLNMMLESASGKNLMNMRISDLLKGMADFRDNLRDTYGILSDIKAIDNAKNEDDAEDLKISAGVKTAMFMEKLSKETLGNSETINNINRRINELAELEDVEDVSDSEVRTAVNKRINDLNKQLDPGDKIDRSNPEHADRIQQITNEIKLEYIDNAKTFKQYQDKIKNIYNNIDERFGYSLSEKEKYERAYRELMSLTWEDRSKRIEKLISELDKSLIEMNAVSLPLADPRTLNEVTRELDGYSNEDRKKYFEDHPNEEKLKGTIDDPTIGLTLKKDMLKKEISRLEKELDKALDARQKGKISYTVKDENGKKQDVVTDDAIRTLYVGDYENIGLLDAQTMLNGIEKDIKKSQRTKQYLTDKGITGEKPVITAENILNLNVSDREFMLDSRNAAKYSVEQLSEIEKAKQLLTERLNETTFESAFKKLLNHKRLVETVDNYNKIKLNQDINVKIRRDLLSEENIILAYAFKELLPLIKNSIVGIDSMDKMLLYIHNMESTSNDMLSAGWQQALKYFANDDSEEMKLFRDALNKDKLYTQVVNNMIGANSLTNLRNLLHDYEEQYNYSSLDTYEILKALVQAYDSLRNSENPEDRIGNADINEIGAVDLYNMFKDDLEDYSDAGKLLARANQIMEGIETSNVKPLLEFLTNNKVTDNTTSKPNSPDEIVNTNNKKSSESVVETILGKAYKVDDRLFDNTDIAVDAIAKESRRVDIGWVGELIYDIYDRLLLNDNISKDKELNFLNKVYSSLKDLIKNNRNSDIINAINTAANEAEIPLSLVFITNDQIEAKRKFDNENKTEFINNEEYDTAEGTKVVVDPNYAILLNLYQGYNMAYASQFEGDNTIHQRFVKYGGRDAIKLVKRGDTVYYLYEGLDGNGDVWMAVDVTDKPTSTSISINGKYYLIIGLISKEDAALKLQYDDVTNKDDVSFDSEKNWDVIISKETNEPINSKVEDIYVAKPISTEKRRDVLETLENEGIPKNKIEQTVDNNLTVVTNDKDHKVLAFKPDGASPRPLMVKSIAETLNENGKTLKLLRDEKKSLIHFNKTTLRFINKLYNFFYSNKGNFNEEDSNEEDSNKKNSNKSILNQKNVSLYELNSLSEKLQSTLNDAIFIGKNLKYSISLTEVSDSKIGRGNRITVSLVQTNNEGAVIGTTELADFTLNDHVKTDDPDFIKSCEEFIDHLLFFTDKDVNLKKTHPELEWILEGNYRVNLNNLSENIHWNINYDVLIGTNVSSESHTSELKRVLHDNLIETNQLFLSPLIAAPTVTNPTKHILIPVQTVDMNQKYVGQNTEGNVPSTSDTSTNSTLTNSLRVVLQMRNSYDKFKKDLENRDPDLTTDEDGIPITSATAVSHMGRTFKDDPDKKALYTGVGNTLDRFLRKVFDRLIKPLHIGIKGENWEQQYSSLEEIQDIEQHLEVIPNANIEFYLRLYNSIVNRFNSLRLADSLISNVEGGLEPVILGDGKTITIDQVLETPNGKRRVRGELDLLMKDKDDFYYIYDFKAVFNNGNNAAEKINNNLDMWATQVQLYAEGLKLQYGINIKEARVIPIIVNAESLKDVQRFEKENLGDYERVYYRDNDGKDRTVQLGFLLSDITENLLNRFVGVSSSDQTNQTDQTEAPKRKKLRVTRRRSRSLYDDAEEAKSKETNTEAEEDLADRCK